MLMWVGFGLSSGNALVLTAVTAAMAAAYHRRTAAEEAMLTQELGAEYASYAERIARVIPGVY